MFFRHWIRLSIVLTILCGAGATAHAQTDQERAGARSAAQEGIRALEEGRHQEAIEFLQKAERLVHAPVHLLYLARAYRGLGKLVAAREHYTKVVVENIPENAPRAFLIAQQDAREELKELEGRIPKLTLRVMEYDGDDLEIQLNGDAFPTTLLGVPTPLDPGEVEITASAPGRQVVRHKVSLAEGAREAVSLELREPVEETPPVAESVSDSATSSAAPARTGSAAEQDHSRDRAPRTSARQRLGFLVGGAGVALVGVGSTFGVMALHQRNKAVSDASLCPDFVCSPEGRRVVTTANRQATVATIGVGVGAAALGLGLYLILGRRADEKRTLALFPGGTQDNLTLNWGGDF